MKQTLLITLFSFAITSFIIASTDTITDTITDKMAVIGSPGLSSDPCAAIDEKVLRLDRFTEVVKNTSAFHLEEKATALTVPGITVSNNKKKMLRAAKKKYAEYAAERQKYGCEIPVTTSTAHIADTMPILDSCAALENKVQRLDRFTQVVKHTSAFHLEEKANAIPTPGITVSNNRKKMLKDAERKYAEYAAENQKYGCKISLDISQKSDELRTVNTATLSSGSSTDTVKKPMSTTESTTKVSSTTAVHVEKKTAVVPVAKTTVSDNKEEMAVVAVEKDEEPSTARQTSNVETPVTVSTAQIDEKITASDDATFSPEKCNTLDEELIELSEFTSMVKNTSAFHLEEKARALPSPGFTVSNNKKKMLRDIEKRHSELLAERKKYGCEPL
jgi:virulence-associated protein VapD